MNKNSYIHLRRELTTPSKNSYVYKLGFKYAIQWYKQSYEVDDHIAKTFGPAAKSYHYHVFYPGKIMIKAMFVSETPRRWYYGSQRWNERQPNQPHWAVFKTEKERTLALLMF